MVDDLDAEKPVRRITHSYDTCIFCGNCEDNCTTETGIALSNKWDLANLDRASTRETHEFELQMCEKCGALVGTKKHLIWLYDKLGPLAYTNPSLLIAKNADMLKEPKTAPAEPKEAGEVDTSDFMRILCPECKCSLNVQL
jgi:ferredoxin